MDRSAGLEAGRDPVRPAAGRAERLVPRRSRTSSQCITRKERALSAEFARRGAVSVSRTVAAGEAAESIGAPLSVAELTMRRRLRPPPTCARRRMKNLAEKAWGQE